jgi:hypothetical protein
MERIAFTVAHGTEGLGRDLIFRNLNGYQQEQQAKPYDCDTKKEIDK